jgi:GT2 family glycosyltransferase
MPIEEDAREEKAAPPKLVAGKMPPAGRYDADIIILTMGRVEETMAAVASAMRQQDVSCYIALLDQGDCPAAAQRYARLFEGRLDAGLFVSPQNLGVGGGRNFLGSLGHGKIIVAIDNDAVFADAFVVVDALRIFAASPLLGAIGFRILDGAGRHLDDASWGYPAALKARSAERFLTTTFVGAGHAIRRAAWADAEGYDEKLFFTWEEYDFALRAIACGWRVEYRGELSVRHRLATEARVRWQAGRTEIFVRNRLVIARKWGVAWVALVPRIAGYLVKGGLNGAFWAALRGVGAAAAWDREIKRRKMTPSMRLYVREHENRHRGNPAQRVAREVFGKVSDGAAAGRASG